MTALRSVGVLVALGTLLGPTVGAAQESGRNRGAVGGVVGTVRYQGNEQAGEVRITRDQEVCGEEPVLDDTLLVGADRGLAGVVVSLDGVPAQGPTAAPSGADVELTLQRCRFSPRVLSLVLGRKLTIRNTDALLHRLRAHIGEITVFEWAMPLPQRLSKKVRHVGRMEVRCAVHSWERAWVVVLPHPYHAVTDAAGTYRIDRVPPGTYIATFWHERLGEKTRNVAVDAQAPTRLNLSYQ